MDLANDMSALLIRNQLVQDSLHPFVASFRGSGILDEVSYHVMVESAEPDSTCWTAATSIAKSLTGKGFVSLTSALDKALRDCHADLVTINKTSDPASRIGVSATCLAFRGTDLYLSRAGDSLLYMKDSKGTRQLLPGDDFGPKFGLGVDGSDPAITMERHILIGQETFLICSNSLKQVVSHDGIDAILSAAPNESMNKLGLIMDSSPFFVAMLTTTRR